MVQIMQPVFLKMINNKITYICIALILLLVPQVWGQDDEDEDFYGQQLVKEVEVENPVYKPVLSLGTGVLHFLGDVRSQNSNPLVGDIGYKFNISTFVGENNYYRLNFFLLYGNLQGHDFELSRQMQSNTDYLTQNNEGNLIFHNSTFKTDFFELGVNLEYNFGHWLGMKRRFRPYFSIGVSPFIFDPKGNIYNQAEENYHFWDDGTIRNLPQSHHNAFQATEISFDNDWETDLLRSDFHGIGNYTQTALVVPIEAGFDFYLSYRVNLRISTSLHYTFTDLLDNFNNQAAEKYGLEGDGFNDMFMFTNFSINFDLFSDPEMIKVDLFFAEIDFDYDVMFADQDMDAIYDRLDECPDTPSGVQVDSVGCPFDSDLDGIPDYIDEEANTPSGAVVDDSGVQISEDKLAEMFEKPTAVRREEAEVIPVAPIWTRSITFTPGEIPSKFKEVDKDGDGYVTFEELLEAVEKFFDGTLDLTVEEIYELNTFFFSQ